MHTHHHKTETSARPGLANSSSKSELGVTSSTDERVQKGKLWSEAAVRVRAYLKWEAAGKPKGDGVKFWLESEHELLRAK
jgi:hypothetical protein